MLSNVDNVCKFQNINTIHGNINTIQRFNVVERFPNVRHTAAEVG